MPVRYSCHKWGLTGAFSVWQMFAATRAGLVSHTREPLGEPVTSRQSGALSDIRGVAKPRGQARERFGRVAALLMY